jgi:alpha-galactosidase
MRPDKKPITSTFVNGRSWKFGVKKLLSYDLWSVCRLVMVVGVALTTVVQLRAGVDYDASSRRWTLKSGSVEYRLRQQNGAVLLEYFGPSGQPAWGETPKGPFESGYEPRRDHDISGQVEGQQLSPDDLELVSHAVERPRAGVEELKMVFKHRRLPLEITVLYTTWGDTGVFTGQLVLRNQGDRPLQVEALPSLSWRLPEGNYDLTYLWGGWGDERQIATEELGANRRSLVSTLGRSSREYSPWFCLHDEDRSVRYMAQLAYSGNWEMHFERPKPSKARLVDEELEASLGVRFDFGGALRLPAHGSFTAPMVAFTASSGDLDDAANQLHRYQRQFVIPHIPENDPLLVQFNTTWPFQNIKGPPGPRAGMTMDRLKPYVDVAADLGVEMFVLDGGWTPNATMTGDWVPDMEEFPHGLEELVSYVRSKGMKFGIWIEIESPGIDSQLVREHPEWCLTYNGQPIKESDRYHLDFAKPQVQQWARSVVDRLVRDYKIDWLKNDYNIYAGEWFDPPGTDQRSGDVLDRHLRGLYNWLDYIRATYPNVIIENCASGGGRFDLGIMARAHTSWLSDVTDPKASVQLGYGCTVEFIPEVCNHWVTGDEGSKNVTLTNPPGWWDFMLRVPMNGQFGMSSQLVDWNSALKQRVKENLALYKRIRHNFMGADVYHLTPPPAHDNPTGWCGMQYVSPDRKHSLLMAYRLDQSNWVHAFKLRGLESATRYQLSVDGTKKGVFSGRDLTDAGLPVELGEQWRAAVVELEALP